MVCMALLHMIAVYTLHFVSKIVHYFYFSDILNQQFKIYTSLSQTCSDVKMVQSLIPIWEVWSFPTYKLFYMNQVKYSVPLLNSIVGVTGRV